MDGFITNIKEASKTNTFFRRVLYTGKHSQVVLMTLKPKEEIGLETHADNDQFFRFEEGRGKVVIKGEEFKVNDGDVVVIPAGTEHNIINTSETNYLKLYTIYSPAHHPNGTIHKTKEEATED